MRWEDRLEKAAGHRNALVDAHAEQAGMGATAQQELVACLDELLAVTGAVLAGLDRLQNARPDR